MQNTGLLLVQEGRLEKQPVLWDSFLLLLRRANLRIRLGELAGWGPAG